MKRGFKTERERHSVSLRSELGLHAKDPLYAKALARHMGIVVVTPSHIQGLTQEDFDELCGRGSSNWSAVTVVTSQQKFIIHNSTHNLGRQESNIMHELAHLMCDHEPSEIIQFGGFSFPIRTCDTTQEDEANWVCGCLKLPRDGILWAVQSGMNHERIAEHFVSSLDLVRYRIRITGVEQQVRRARQKWKK